MEFKGIVKKDQGRFITRYDLTYKTEDGFDKVYEMISRDNDIKSFEELHDRPADAVVLIMHSEDGERILINKEFRLAPGEWVFNFPAGLIDPGEDYKMAAERELREETGLQLVEIEDVIAESYSAVGFSNEKNICVVGCCRGEITGSDSSLEEIEAGWYTRNEVRELLKTEKFAARTQAYCYMWVKTK
ncbi:NUDIX hydrolase [Eubacterium sp.]|uniref:NUDIX hydrolase n=1 Tax=Eubacterium sp. TaxID=142586 RepID=UPI0025906FF2|nr:NUDIX hydrolase [Eubacterium sp.]MCR5367208.1 NUDIX hydrolase [Eubacterium sp.]